MKQSKNRILTTHTGRLDGPPEFRELSREIQAGRRTDLKNVMPQVRDALLDVIRNQVNAGIDIISDGEVGKFGFGTFAYYQPRLEGSGPRKTGETSRQRSSKPPGNR